MKIKVLSYNVKNGAEVSYDYAVIGADLKAENADLIGLQELDLYTRRNGNRDALREIAESAGYAHYAYTKAIDYSGGGYGTGILSRYPIEAFEGLPLESYGKEQRMLSHAVIWIEGRRVDFYNTHFSLGGRGMREVQFAKIAEEIRDKELFFVTGDFNTEDFSEFARLPNTRLLNCKERKYLSFSGESAIDNILYPAQVSLLSSFLRNGTGHSDHDMIGGEFEV